MINNIVRCIVCNDEYATRQGILNCSSKPKYNVVVVSYAAAESPASYTYKRATFSPSRLYMLCDCLDVLSYKHVLASEFLESLSHNYFVLNVDKLSR